MSEWTVEKGGGLTGSIFTPLFYISVRAHALGASSALAFYILAIFNAASFFGRLAGALGDWVGR